MVLDGLWCAFEHYHMGVTAENIAKQFCISRQEQDEFACASQQKANEAMNKGKFKDKIVHISVSQKQAKSVIFDTDEGIKPNTTQATLQKLRPAFDKKSSDGIAIALVMKEKKAKELRLTPLVSIEASAVVEPSIMSTAPITTIKKCLQKANWSLGEIDLIETNEAFTAQALCVSKELKLNPYKLNINTGAIAIGHPIGAFGTRCLVTLIRND